MGARAQLQIELAGKKMVAMMRKRLPSVDMYHRRSDNIVLVDKQMAVRLQRKTGGSPKVEWNGAVLTQLKLVKSELVAELARATPAGADEVSWES